MTEHQNAVYILASHRNGTLYIGVKNNLSRRLDEHRHQTSDGFTKQYGVAQLVYIETTASVVDAIAREKQLKHWKREWKISLIESTNPNWRDLSSELA